MIWHPASRTWRPTFRSTLTTNKQKAEAVAVEYQRLARMAMGEGDSMMTREKALATVNAILRASGVIEHQAVRTWKSYAAEWLETETAGKATGTAKNYASCLRFFDEWAGKRVNDPLDSFTPSDIQKYYNQLIRPGRGTTSARNVIKPVRAIFRRAYAEGLCTRDPGALLKQQDSDALQREPFTYSDIQQIFAYLEASGNTDWLTVAHLGLCTGARLGDCAKLGSANLADGVISFVPQKTKRKRKTPVRLPVVEPLASYLKGLPRRQGPFAPYLSGLSTIGYKGLSDQFRQILTDAKIPMQVIEGEGKQTRRSKSFHSFRHTLTSLMANAGVAEDVRMKIVAHEDAKVHAGYTHTDIETYRGALEKALSAVQPPVK